MALMQCCCYKSKPVQIVVQIMQIMQIIQNGNFLY